MLTTQTTGETYRRKYPLYTSIKIRHSNLEKIKFDSEEDLLYENTKKIFNTIASESFKLDEKIKRETKLPPYRYSSRHGLCYL